MGITRLAKGYGNDRVEAACLRAMAMGVGSYQSVKSILTTGKDSEPMGVQKVLSGCKVTHENIRGREYYGGTMEARKPA